MTGETAFYHTFLEIVERRWHDDIFRDIATKELSLSIQLIDMTLEEVRRVHSDAPPRNFRTFRIAEGAAPPDIIIELALSRVQGGELWFWCAPRLFVLEEEHLIVGSGCFKNSPREGAVEIGCGVAEAYQGRGFATQGIELMVVEGFSSPDVSAITAETAVWNAASQRALEKACFARCGSRIDSEDGEVICWRRERADY